MNTPPDLVVFDLYGTLVRFGVMHHPFRKILKWARDKGRTPQVDDARRIMTANKEVEELLLGLDIYPPREMLLHLEREINEELDSLTLFDDVLPTLTTLLSMGVRLAICSNLARPYGVVIDRLLNQFDFIRCLSFEVGAIKPEPEIYDWIVQTSNVQAEKILFVGDTQLADYDGPVKFGFNAKHLVREQSSGNFTIASLCEILKTR
jgi:HAD superfamily hydrolase (TIGR01549 family)